jgi:hypothetical protein
VVYLACRHARCLRTGHLSMMAVMKRTTAPARRIQSEKSCMVGSCSSRPNKNTTNPSAATNAD